MPEGDIYSRWKDWRTETDMKIVDKKGKFFGKINIIDLCVIAVLVVLVIGAYYKFVVMDKTSATSTMQKIEYQVRIEKVRSYSLNNIETGDKLYDKTSGNAIGTIVGVESEPATEKVRMPDGSIVMGEVENRINIILTVEAEGVVSESGSFVNRTYELLVGSQRKFTTKYIECSGIISKIL